MQDDMHNLPRRFSAVVFKCLFDGCSWTSLAHFLPPFYTSLPRSLPQAFCSSARREERMMESNAHHSAPVSEFLFRHGNASTCLQTHSNTLCARKHARTPTHSNTQSSCRWKQTGKNMEEQAAWYSWTIYKLQAGGVCKICQHVWISLCM